MHFILIFNYQIFFFKMTNLFCTTTSYRRDPHSFLVGVNTAAYPEILYSRTDILGSIPGNILILAKPMTQTTSSKLCFASFKENNDIFIYTHSSCTDPVYIYDRCLVFAASNRTTNAALLETGFSDVYCITVSCQLKTGNDNIIFLYIHAHSRSFFVGYFSGIEGQMMAYR